MTEQLIERTKTWYEDLVYYIKEGCKSFLTVGKLLVEGEKKELWRSGEYKSFREFLDSGTLGIGKSQAYQFIHAYQNAQNLKLTEEKAIAIGITKLALIHKLPKEKQSVHIVDKSKVSELQSDATHIQALTFYIDNEEAKVVEQALNTILKKEGMDNKGHALYLMSADYLSGAGWHEDRPLTGREKQGMMREAWSDWKENEGWEKEYDKFYGRYAKSLELALTIPQERRKQGFKAITDFFHYKGMSYTMETVLKHFPIWETNPERYEVEKSFQEKLSKREEARK